MRRKNESLQSELDQLRSLLDYIRNRSEVESMEIYRRVRAAADPMDVVELLRGSDLLLRNSGTTDRAGGSETPASGLGNLELSALEHSSIKVRATPWTRVAGDGLVSELISSFFAYDNGFYLSFIDQECFLDDMQAGDTANSDFCSPLLVNAICALRCVGHSIVVRNHAAADIPIVNLRESQSLWLGTRFRHTRTILERSQAASGHRLWPTILDDCTSFVGSLHLLHRAGPRQRRLAVSTRRLRDAEATTGEIRSEVQESRNCRRGWQGQIPESSV